MAELGQGNKSLYLTDKNKVKQQQYQPRFITEDGSETYSSKVVYFRWLSRLVVLCAVSSLAFFLSASLVIFRLAPEIIVEPLLIINQSSSDNMVRYEPITEKMPSMKQFTEMFIKQYVSLRNTVINDEQEMRTRWGPGGLVHHLSAPDIYQEFVGKNIDNVDKMFDNDYSSEVRIDEIGKISETSPAWYVIFTVYHLSRAFKGKDGSLVLETTKYKASITPKFFPENRVYFSRLINPLGFTVIKYNQDEIRE